MHIAHVESADLIAEAFGPAQLTRLAYASALVAARAERCYCEPALVDRRDSGQLGPCAPVDPYAAALARWFGVSNGEVDTILRDL